MNYTRIARASLCAALVIGFSSYLSQTSHPFLAGLLIAIPVALPSLWFIENKNAKDMKEYLRGFAISITIYCIVALFFYYMVVKSNYDKKKMIIFAMMLWFTIILICYYTFR
jgi:heme/copper-type cytochrome/quinol oxidase subunit 4